MLGFILTSLPHDLRRHVVEHWYNERQNLVTIRLDESFEGGTDTQCETAARLFHAICNQGFTLYVLPYHQNGWIPSRINPMTIEWTQKLISPTANAAEIRVVDAW